MADQRPKREEVYELREKIYGMLTVASVASLPEFCSKADVAYEGLRTCWNGTGRQGLSADYQKNLAQFVGFRLDWPEWIEPNRDFIREGKRRDTAKAFLERCLKEIRPRPEQEVSNERLPMEPEKPGPRLRAIRPAKPEACHELLASLEMFANQPPPGNPWPFSVDLSCRMAWVEGVRVAVQRGLLTFHCAEGETGRLETRKGFPGGFPLGNATCIPGGYTYRPTWEVISASGPLGNLSFPEDFCPISGLMPGSIVTVTFSVHIKNLEDEEKPEETASEEGNSATTDGDFIISQQGVALGPAALGLAKKKILKRLALKQVPSLGDDESQEEKEGRKVICLDRRRFQAEDKAEGA